MIDLVSNINQQLVSAQHKNIQEMIGPVDVSLSPSSNPDLAVATKGEAREIAINHGLLLLLDMIDFIVMSRLEGPETEYQPYCSYEACFVASLELAIGYLKHDISLTVKEIVIPSAHPYNHIVGALNIAQIAFVFAHEYGHILLKHDKVRPNVLGLSEAGIAMSLKDADDLREMERLADHLATEMFTRYLITHNDYLVRDIGFAGPVLLFQWISFCENMVASVFSRKWIPELISIGFSLPKKTVQKKNSNHIYVHRHGHPLGSERESSFNSMIKWEAVSEFTKSVIFGSKQIVNSFLTDAKHKKRRKVILTKYGY